MISVTAKSYGLVFSLDSKMDQSKYLRLCDDTGSVKCPPEEVIPWIEKEFGFSPDKIKIEESAELWMYTGPSSSVPIGLQLDRRPVYNSTDRNYARFRVCGQLYEIVNGDLEMLDE